MAKYNRYTSASSYTKNMNILICQLFLIQMVWKFDLSKIVSLASFSTPTKDSFYYDKLNSSLNDYELLPISLHKFFCQWVSKVVPWSKDLKVTKASKDRKSSFTFSQIFYDNQLHRSHRESYYYPQSLGTFQKPPNSCWIDCIYQSSHLKIDLFLFSTGFFASEKL